MSSTLHVAYRFVLHKRNVNVCNKCVISLLMTVISPILRGFSAQYIKQNPSVDVSGSYRFALLLCSSLHCWLLITLFFAIFND
jgi:hypothetical protein